MPRPQPQLATDELIFALAQYSRDPLAFVQFAYPWGKAETELEHETGPNDFQKGVLEDLRDGLLDANQAIQLATTSGHGVGKSALVAWLLDWAQSTFADTKGVVTANTENQLKTKTWVEMAKWHRLSITNALFKLTATARFSRDPNHESTWRIDMVPWSERNTEAFAGLHNQGKRIIVVFDEGSAIPDIIWEVTEGALTDRDTQIIWSVFGNPTRATGRFRECFPGGRFAHRWQSRKVDSRTVPQTDKEQLQRWVDDWGIGHDFVKVRVLGEFPSVDADSFISAELAREAVGRIVVTLPEEPIVLGVDVARQGQDFSVIYPRQGRDAYSRPIEVYGYADTQRLIKAINAAYYRYKATFVFVDGTGLGGPICDQLRNMQLNVIEVNFGQGADGGAQGPAQVDYANKRSEIWGAMREWLHTGSIPEMIPQAGRSLVDELAGPSFKFIGKNEAIQLESKDSMKRRKLPSPDVADALACTFAYSNMLPDPIERTEVPWSSNIIRQYETPEFDLFQYERL